MKASVNISKISPPHLPPILYRSRLIDLLEKNKNKKLILILGQAAQGKTTLVTCYVKNSKIPFAWLNLDQSDSDPINLFHLIVQSLQKVLKEIDLSPLLYESNGMICSTSAIQLFRHGADFISKNISYSINLVFDGLDLLYHQDPLPFQCLQAFIENLSPNVHLIMLSRGEPPLSLKFQDLKIKQEMFTLLNEDLAFTPHEIKEFFQKVKKLSLDEHQTRKIHVVTEGWAGGLILLSESLLRLPSISRKKFINQELPNFFHKEIFQYFDKEILSSQSKEVQQFLLKLSLLDIVEPHIARELLETERVEEILRDHARNNFFILSFYDEKRGWLFQYHRMLRNFLKSRYIAETTAEERVSFHLKIGNLLKQKGDLENAIKYFLEANAYSQAIPLIEQLGMDFLRKGEKGNLASWMDALPEGLLQKNPWLLLYQTMTKQQMAAEENVISLQKAYQLFKKNGVTRGELISLAHLISTIVQTGIHLFHIHSLIKKAEALLESAEVEAYPYERATLLYCIGHAYFLGEGDIRKGIRACENAYLISKQIHDISLQTHALIFSALGFICVGEFSRAEEACQKFETLSEIIDYHKELKAMGMMASGFRVFRGESLIEEKEWIRHQPKLLLKAILSRGMTAIPKEILIEDLWPEEKTRQGENNLKTTLQRLRMSLEPDLSNEFKSSYVHLHDNQIVLDHELCQVDLNQFLNLIKKGEELEKRGEEKKALSFYTEALEIYKGDFLKEDLYSPWAENKREELRNKYIEILQRIAHLHDRQGSFKKATECYKKVIQADPLLEESYQKLMTLYSSKGLYNEALKTYEACNKVLKKELKANPDAMTDAIYNKILDRIGVPQKAKPKYPTKKSKLRG